MGASVLPLLLLAWFLFLRPPFLGGSTHYVTVSGTSMLPTLHENDVVVLAQQGAYANGDIIAYTVRDDPTLDGLRVIHRVIGGSATEGYITKGDNRATPDTWHPTRADVIGRRVAVLPRAGVVLKALKSTPAIATLAMLWLVVLFWRPRRNDPATTAVAARRPIRTRSTFEKLTFRDRSDRYDDVARTVRRRYLLEDDLVAKRAIRAMTFDLAATYATADPHFDRGAFLEACGTFTEATPPH